MRSAGEQSSRAWEIGWTLTMQNFPQKTTLAERLRPRSSARSSKAALSEPKVSEESQRNIINAVFPNTFWIKKITISSCRKKLIFLNLDPVCQCLVLKACVYNLGQPKARSIMEELGKPREGWELPAQIPFPSALLIPPVAFPFKGYTQNISVFYLSSNSRLQCDFSFRLYWSEMDAS